MAVTPTDDLLERLKDPEYAKLYGAENAKVDFAITLTKARKSLNLTQKSLADKLGISQPYVAKLEGGEANPTLGTVGSLLATLGYRLVTQTAPLHPEPVSSVVQLMGAAHVGEYPFCEAAALPRGEEEYTANFSAAGEPSYDWLQIRKEDSTAKVAVAGGAV